MNFQRKKWLCMLLILFLAGLAIIPGLMAGKKQARGEYITTQEIKALSELLTKAVALTPIENRVRNLSHEYFTYGQLLEWMEEEAGTISEMEEFRKKYEEHHFILKEDWYRFFNHLCLLRDPEGKIRKQELLILGDSTGVRDIEGRKIGENQLLSDNGLWTNQLPFREELVGKTSLFITFEGALWGQISSCSDGELKNAWLMESNPEETVYFYDNHEVTTSSGSLQEKPEGEVREQIADLKFRDGGLEAVSVKSQRISGEVLKLTDTLVEIRGEGTFTLDDCVQYYRLYDTLENVGRNAIRIGYNFTDFVVQDGKIQAGLLMKDEKMEAIRVLLKNAGFESCFHDEFICSSDVDMELVAGEERRTIPAGEQLELKPDSEYFQQGRVFLQPAALSGKIYVSGLERSNDGQGYRGKIEVEKRPEGLLVINEVLLEEYLYGVVPSEMPASYPLEALKAQAVTARTYAYRKMKESSLGSYGAHVDDSSSYQVYNNVAEQTDTTRAVKETSGILLCQNKEPVQTYYYSTSWGYGTDTSIWQTETLADPLGAPHLQARSMSLNGNDLAVEELKQEEVFRSCLDGSNSDHFEQQEAWYRWSYEHDNMDEILENLRNCQKQDPENILVGRGGTGYRQEEIPGDFVITGIRVGSRGPGGYVKELLFEGETVLVLLKKEQNIRMVLTDSTAQATLQDGTLYTCKSLLPSSYFYIETQNRDGQVSSLTIKGGGFGHGVGMSQNGAKNLAIRGYNFEEILLYYYQGCQMWKEGKETG